MGPALSLSDPCSVRCHEHSVHGRLKAHTHTPTFAELALESVLESALNSNPESTDSTTDFVIVG